MNLLQEIYQPPLVHNPYTIFPLFHPESLPPRQLQSITLPEEKEQKDLREIAAAEKMAVIKGANIAIKNAQKQYQTKVKEVTKTSKTKKGRALKMHKLREEFTLSVKMIQKLAK